MQVKVSKKLIGSDDKNNVSNFKYTNFVDICPLCKDDLLYLPAKLARTLGNIARCVLVKNVSNIIHVIDPLSGQTASMSVEQYWRDPIRPIITAARSRLARYVVLGKEPVVIKQNISKKAATRKNRNRLASVTLAKESDLGENDVQFEERSHVGYLLKAGDICLGYDLHETQLVGENAEQTRDEGKLPAVVMVRKLYGGVATGESNAAKMRIWQLQRLDVDVAESLRARTSKKEAKEAEQNDMDEEDFYREVEADREMRNNMNVYKSEVLTKKKNDSDETMMDSNALDSACDDDDDENEEDDQQVKLDELLDGLVLTAGPDDKVDAAVTAAMEDDAEEKFWAQGGADEGDKAAKDGISYVGREDARLVRERDAAKPVTGNAFGTTFMGKDFKFI